MVGFWCLTPPSTICQSYRSGQLFSGGTGVSGENDRPVRSHLPWTGFELKALVMIGTNCVGSKSKPRLKTSTSLNDVLSMSSALSHWQRFCLFLKIVHWNLELFASAVFFCFSFCTQCVDFKGVEFFCASLYSRLTVGSYFSFPRDVGTMHLVVRYLHDY